MRSRILAITGNSLLELHKRKVSYLAVVLVILVSIAPTYLKHKLFMFGIADYKLGYVYQDFVISSFKLLSLLGLLASILLASGSLEYEVMRRTLSSVITRPIQRWEYLLGRLFGVIAFYALIILSGIVCIYLFALLLNFSVPDLFLWGVLERFFQGVALITVAFSLGVLTSSISALLTLLVAVFFALLLPHIPADIHLSIGVAKNIVHYTTPSDWISDYFTRSVYQGEVEFNFLKNSLVMLENLMYGAVFFLLSALIFTKRDIKLKDS